MAVERPTEPIDDPVGDAADLVRRAELDVGAASLAAEAGDHDIAYALLLDAVDGWRLAHDLLVDEVEHLAAAAKAGPVPLATVATDPAVPDPVAVAPPITDRPEPPPEAEAEPPPAEAAGGEEAETSDAREGETHRTRFERVRRRRSPRRDRASGDSGGTVEASERIAPVVAPEGSEDEYHAWADRLREQRAELKGAAGVIDLTVVRRTDAEPGRRGPERGPTPSPG
jgi:hypothetical protein